MWRDLSIAGALVALAALGVWHADGYMATGNSGPPQALSGFDPTAVPDAERPPSAPRVVLVIVDGMRDDALELLGLELSHPRLAVARCSIMAHWPSYSRASYATIGTGAPPTLTGVVTNSYRGPVKLGSIFLTARSAGMRVHLATDGNDWWTDLFPGVWHETSTEDNEFGDALDRLLRDGGPELALVHSDKTDTMGHDFGGDSPEYREAVADAGRWLRELIERADPDRDTVIVTADHGHVDRGGHGGPELEVLKVPLVVFGRRVRPGSGCQDGGTDDLAPTIAAILDLDPPPHTLGHALLELLSLPNGGPDRVRARELAQRDALLDELGDPPTWRRPAAGPVALAIGVWGLLLLGLLLGLAGRRPTARGLIVAASFPAAFVCIYLAAEPVLSFSAAWSKNPWLLRLAALTAAALAVRTAIAAILLRRQTDPERRANLAVSTAAALLPLFVAIGVHGSPWLGPELGEPHAAFAVLAASFVASVAALWLLAEHVGGAVIRRRRRTGS